MGVGGGEEYPATTLVRCGCGEDQHTIFLQKKLHTKGINQFITKNKLVFLEKVEFFRLACPLKLPQHWGDIRCTINRSRREEHPKLESFAKSNVAGTKTSILMVASEEVHQDTHIKPHL